MTAFLALFRKDMVLFFTNRRAMVMSFVAPILMASFFAFIFGGQSTNRADVAVGFVDEDASAISTELANKLDAEEGVALQKLSKSQAEKLVRDGKLSVAVVIPKGFGDQASRGVFRRDLAKPEVELLFDPSRTIERQMVQGLLAGRVMETVTSAAMTSKTLADETIAELDRTNEQAPWAKNLRELLQNTKELNRNLPSGGSGPGLTLPFTTKARSMAKRGGENMAGHYFSGMGVQFILFLGIEGGVALLLQRQRGLWKRFRAAPVSRYTLVLARAASSAVCALAIIAVMFLFARLVFDIRVEGSLVGFALVAISIAILTAAYGLCIAALGKTPEGARPIATLVTLLLVMLGGAWLPVFLFPAWLSSATLITPTRWAVDGLDAMTWRGLEIDFAMKAAAVLLAWAAAFAAIALLRFRWEQD